MPRRLILLRHAKSAWPADVPDHERPLGSRGQREAPLAGRWLAEHVGDVDLVVCSSAQRTRQTWERVGAELADPGPADPGPADTEPADTKLTDTKLTDTKLTDTEPTCTEPTDTEPTGRPELRVDDRLYDATAGDLLRVARELPDAAHTVLFIGHNPGLEDLVEALTGDWCTMLTSTIAVLSVPGDWADLSRGQATLDSLHTPR